MIFVASYPHSYQFSRINCDSTDFEKASHFGNSKLFLINTKFILPIFKRSLDQGSHTRLRNPGKPGKSLKKSSMHGKIMVFEKNPE